ncbi:thioredoxin [Pseudalkalibacillus decolorationis]|uniref:thioredoxin n=1 Tax=Pseudalkalibacillus decolorationis TaxID=163879 RepID=UPI0021482FFE|nr:thioredoxin [Pseudalkalibacillus decolorationis]
MIQKSGVFLSIPMLAILALLSSCQFTPTLNQLPINFDKAEVHTLLFSAGNYQSEERSYYDALLNLQNKYPDKLNSIKIIQKKNSDIVQYFNISTYPTLIIMNGKEVEVRVEGHKDSEHITQTIEPVYKQ